MDLTIRQAEERLIEWGVMYADKGNVAALAYDAGVQKSRIAQLMGLDRGTINRILAARAARVEAEMATE